MTMSVTDVMCAFCDENVYLGDDHVEIEGAHKPRREFANIDEFVAHPECWADATADWREPL